MCGRVRDRDRGHLRNVGPTATIDPYSTLAGRKAELLRWLAEGGRFAPDTGRLLELLCDKLAALGIPIARATVQAASIFRRCPSGTPISLRS
jgi:hypothetical protein